MGPTHVIADIIGQVVSRTETVVLPSLVEQDTYIKALNYEHGHPLEIIDKLMQKDQSTTYRDKRLPAIFLFQDFKEVMFPKPGIYCQAQLNLIIAYETRSDYMAEDRYTHSFKNVLYPIYHEFIDQLQGSGFFIMGGSGPQHDKIDRLYWGKKGINGNTATVGNDFLDCIEINNLNLSVKEQICKICPLLINSNAVPTT